LATRLSASSHIEPPPNGIPGYGSGCIYECHHRSQFAEDNPSERQAIHISCLTLAYRWFMTFGHNFLPSIEFHLFMNLRHGSAKCGADFVASSHLQSAPTTRLMDTEHRGDGESLSWPWRTRGRRPPNSDDMRGRAIIHAEGQKTVVAGQPATLVHHPTSTFNLHEPSSVSSLPLFSVRDSVQYLRSCRKLHTEVFWPSGHGNISAFAFRVS